MTQDELKIILEKHQKWQSGDEDGERADLQYANLQHANLQYANLRYAKDFPFISMACPSDGAFIGWKKVGKHLIKHQIPASAKRSSATTNKCRCDKAKVLNITDIKTGDKIAKIFSKKYFKTVYEAGKMVYPDFAEFM